MGRHHGILVPKTLFLRVFGFKKSHYFDFANDLKPFPLTAMNELIQQIKQRNIGLAVL